MSKLTPEQIAKILKKEAETPDALKRNPLNKYTEGYFHVTLNVRGEAPVLGYRPPLHISPKCIAKRDNYMIYK